MGTQKQQTQIVASRKERGKLFNALEAVVNLGDSLKDLERFRLQYPWFKFWSLQVFFPGRMIDPVPVGPELHGLILGARDALREWWRTREIDPCWEGLLLGQDWDGTASVYIEDTLREKFPGATGSSWDLSVDQQEYNKGRKRIRPNTELASAVLLILGEDWRAKTCGVCSKLFVADKPNQRYCSPDCSNRAQADRKERWRQSHSVRKPH